MKLELNLSDLTPASTRPSPMAVDAQREWETTGTVPHSYVESVLGGGFSTLDPVVIHVVLPPAPPANK